MQQVKGYLRNLVILSGWNMWGESEQGLYKEFSVYQEPATAFFLCLGGIRKEQLRRKKTEHSIAFSYNRANLFWSQNVPWHRDSEIPWSVDSFY